MSKGMQMEDLEELRGFGLKYLEGANFNEQQRQALVSIMIRFKDLVGYQRAEVDRNNQSFSTQNAGQEEGEELPAITVMSRHGTP